MLYRSESGDPILLYACADMGESPYPDTEVIVTDSTGKTVTWYPIYGITALPYDYEYDLPLGYSFTVCDEDYGGDMIEESMWTAPTAEQLVRYVWTWQGDLAEQPAMATLELHANSSQEDYWGSATFTWWYESDFVTPEEVYTGDWGLTANGEYSGVIMLDLTRTGGKRYTPGETERIIHDGFIVQVPIAFEDYTYLSVDKGQHGSYLPIQLEPDTVLYFYPQWE